MNTPTTLVWFRQDLRLADNPALSAAAQLGHKVLPFYIHEEGVGRPRGAASSWWLHHSLSSLSKDLSETYGTGLSIAKGKAADLIPQICQQLEITHVFWNRQYDEAGIRRDTDLKSRLKNQGISVESFNGSLLHEPWEVLTQTGQPFKVFTPFWNTLRSKSVRPLLPRPKNLRLKTLDPSMPIDHLGLLPTIPWDTGMRDTWKIGEAPAHKALNHFLESGIHGYKENRNRPDLDCTSRLSPFLHFGELSPVQVWHQAARAAEHGEAPVTDVNHFLSELAWREFSYGLLFTHPDLHWIPLRPEFENFPTRDGAPDLVRWQQGQTGYPIVDAGMRQLWTTGWMHNRVRMIVASFLIKDLLLPWQQGEVWFWDTLVDADPANNAASWQWVAGCGADAAPYFRIFNPILQGEKFDPKGDYVRTWIPELKNVPTTHIHKPWTHPHPPKNYPLPMIDHKIARTRALDAYKQMRNLSTLI